MADNDVYREWRVTCPCGDVIYEGRSWVNAVLALNNTADDRHPGEPNKMEGRTICPWVQVVP